MRSVLLAFQFLTLLPWHDDTPITPAMMGKATVYFPLVGIVTGAILGGMAWGMVLLFPAGVGAALLLAAWVVMTGALHLDGFLDACDGLFGGHTPEERLHIMRDERVGAFALAGGVLLLLIKYTALRALLLTSPTVAIRDLLLPPVLGRLAMVFAIVAFPYAREAGLGRWMKDQAGWREFLGAAIVGLGGAGLILGVVGGLLGLGTLLLTWCIARFMMKRIPGLTGDIYGAICEVVETSVLLVLLLI